jgi:hypothetical protein
MCICRHIYMYIYLHILYTYAYMFISKYTYIYMYMVLSPSFWQTSRFFYHSYCLYSSSGCDISIFCQYPCIYIYIHKYKLYMFLYISICSYVYATSFLSFWQISRSSHFYYYCILVYSRNGCTVEMGVTFIIYSDPPVFLIF